MIFVVLLINCNSYDIMFSKARKYFIRIGAVKMKKWLGLLALLLCFAMLGSAVYAAETPQLTLNYLEEYLKGSDAFETTQAHYSISGASDSGQPLTINGEEIARTTSGYFSYYAELSVGVNEFEIVNGTESKTITITRTVPQTSSGSDSNAGAASDSNTGSDMDEDGFVALDAVGLVNRNHPTVRSRADEASDDLIGPYVKNTFVHIIGKNDKSEYYRTASGAYLYYDSVDLLTDTSYTGNVVQSVTAEQNAVEIKMTRSTEYKCELTSEGLTLTLFDTDGTSGVITLADGIVKNIKKVSNSSAAVYNIQFKEKNSVIGYMCYYDGGTLRIELNKRTVLTDKSLKGVKIVLDAGHGGEQSGTLGLGEIPEKDIALGITNYLGEYLTSKGAEIVYTRSDDSTVALTTRSAKIIAESPDLSVSIHCNSMNPWVDYNDYTGTLNLYTYDSPTEFVETLTNLMVANGAAVPGHTTTYRKQNLALTRTSICPAVLIETGFICNPDECEYLIKSENQKVMAEKIGAAIEQYFYNLESAATDNTTIDNSEKAAFSDIGAHWAKDAITSAFEKGLLNGYDDGTFRPEHAITRAEFLQILYNIYGNAGSSDVTFSDVSADAWYSECVKWGVAGGLTTGYDDNTFRANQEISREEAAVMLSRCANLPTGENNAVFRDAGNISEWAKDSVAKIAKIGIMQGDENGRFNPTQSLTRAEMAVIAGRLS
jgi:N-acetylmuramoyl-L-alanine amidase